MEKYETILLEKKDGIAVITLNLPDILNSLEGRIARDLLRALKDCRQDQEVHVVVLKGDSQAPSFGEYLKGDYLFEKLISVEESRNLTEAVDWPPKPFVALSTIQRRADPAKIFPFPDLSEIFGMMSTV